MRAFLFIIAITVAGCAPTLQQLQSADYGDKPGDAEAQIHGWAEHALKDPYTAHITVHEPEKSWYREGYAYGGHLHYGWMVKADVNAKNSYGGYIGEQRYGFFFENGIMKYTISPDDWASGMVKK